MKAPDDGLPAEFSRWLQNPEGPMPPELREVLKRLAASSDTPREVKTGASRLLFKTQQGDALDSVMTRDKEGQWTHTIFFDMSNRGDWFYAVERADRRPPPTAALEKFLKRLAKRGQQVDGAYRELRELQDRGMR